MVTLIVITIITEKPLIGYNNLIIIVMTKIIILFSRLVLKFNSTFIFINP